MLYKGQSRKKILNIFQRKFAYKEHVSVKCGVFLYWYSTSVSKGSLADNEGKVRGKYFSFTFLIFWKKTSIIPLFQFNSKVKNSLNKLSSDHELVECGRIVTKSKEELNFVSELNIIGKLKANFSEKLSKYCTPLLKN